MHIIMTTKTNHITTKTLAIWVTNLLLVVVLTWRTIQINSDKAPALFMVYYSALLILNGGLWITLWMIDKGTFNDFRRVFLTLLALFIPITIFIAFYH